MTDPVKFIEKIWSIQRTDGKAVGYTCKKDWSNGDWTQYPTRAITELKLPDLEDVYVCPNLFRGPRKAEFFVSSRWLYADLDAVPPYDLDIKPTLAWETSPGRFQAMWLLNRSLTRSRFERLNKRLTYHLKADRGGWSCTKVLRVPGTISTKYGKSRNKRFEVHLVSKGPKWRVEDLMRLLPRADQTRGVKVEAIFGSGGADSLPPRGAVMKLVQGRLPRRAKQLLRAKGAEGDDRSARLWELYNLLLQAGITPLHILVLVRATVWNKYAGQNRELLQLQTEIAKAAEKHAQADEMARLVGATNTSGSGKAKARRNGSPNNRDGGAGGSASVVRGNGRKSPRLRGALARQAEERMERDGPKMLPFLTHEEFMHMHFPKPQWLVDGFWSKGAYGVCVGEYKSYKSMILLELALSVASGKPFLASEEFEGFKVHEPGLVLYLHEEGRQGGIQDRLHRIAVHKGLGALVKGRGRQLEAPLHVPMHVTSFSGFRLTDTSSQERLVNYIIKYKPQLIIMESWYLIASDIDESAAGEVAPVLEWITKVSQEFGVGIIISHHYNKDKETKGRRAIDRISGSGVFGRWFESAIALERSGSEDEYTATIEALHREQKGIPRQTIAVEIDSDNEDDFAVKLVDDDTEKGGAAVRKTDPLTVLPEILSALKAEYRKGIPVSQVLKDLKEFDIDLDYRKLLKYADELGYKSAKRVVGSSDRPIWVLVKRVNQRS